MQFSATLILFILIGVWADKRLATTPWLTVTGSLVGIGGGMFLLIRQLSSIR